MFSAGARAGSEPPGSRSSVLTRPPPQLGLLPVLLQGPPRAPPRPAGPLGKEGAASGPAGEPRVLLPGPAASSRAPPLQGSPPRRPHPGWWRGPGPVARQLAGSRRAQGGRMGERRGLDFRPPRPRYAPDLWNGRGLKPYSKHCTRTPLSRGSPLQFISLP